MARRSTGPWYRADRDAWFVQVGGAQTNLGVRGRGNRARATAAWHRVLAGESPQPATAPPEPPRAATVPVPEPEPTGVTVRELAALFLADAAARLKASTVRTYRQDLKSFVARLGHRPATALAPAEVTAWLHSMKVCSTSKAIRLSSVRSCFGWAVRTDVLDRNPVSRVHRPPSASRSERAVIAPGVHAKMLAAASPEFRLVLKVLHGTGCRPGEVCQISTATFHPEQGLARLHVHKSDKGGRARIVYLPGDVVALLKAQAARYGAGPLLRTKYGNAWTAKKIWDAVRKTRTRAGVKAIAYGYRHTFATDALVKGVPDAQVAALLGHASTTMLHKHYSHLTSHTGVLRQAASVVRPGSSAA